MWEDVESVVKLYVSSKLLETIEVALKEGRPDGHALTEALILRLLCSTMTAITEWMRENIAPVLQSRVSRHYADFLLCADIRLDLPTSQAVVREAHATGDDDAWAAFDGLCEIAGRFLGFAAQLALICQQSTGLVFSALSIIQPVLTLWLYRTLWMKSYVVYSENPEFLQMKALQSMRHTKYRGDVISGNIAGWIAAEYRRARDALGSTSDVDYELQYAMERNPTGSVAKAWAGELPTLYWSINAMMYPSQFSISSIAILQQYASSLNYSLQTLFWDLSRLTKCVRDIRTIYGAADINNRVVDGNAPYPPDSEIFEGSRGMALELENVSFTYPGGQSAVNALYDISFKIPAGALVVIVGANGSGKSTIMKLLSRLYDADTGVIRVDGRPITEYCLADLRQAQATLTQDHMLYPLTLRENIGLGCPEHVDNDELVTQAAHEGGSSKLIARLTCGLNTRLSPTLTAQGYHLDDHKTLKSVLATLENTTDVSGGEKQRLAASRTFMRLNDNQNKIRLLIVDEPSSALDPQGEFELYQRLRETGKGKTMIFVTHRFGHLTKHANLVICMKDGIVAQTGTHGELMAQGGEYAALYEVQAQAFAEG
ncbi:P-loop containing nucleoside triphosphate hydrolase protein [Mycena filopes]|nr:P-loop containing nucleoside triphosphate hydrolase protein [Mycena filopes]